MRASGLFKPAQTWVGIAAGLLFLSAFIGWSIGITIVVVISSFAALVIFPLWLIWTGLTFIKSEKMVFAPAV
jgi:hypothetical protein